MAALDALLRTMLDKGGSDLHLTIGLPPKARISGSLTSIGDEPLDAATMRRLLQEICPEHRWADFMERHDLDLAHEIPEVARFRGNFLYNHWGMAAVFRQIPAKILSFDTLKLPEALKKLCHLDQGLVVVTGPTGSGKSTTLAAMIDYINDHLAKHIITIEDPIEFVHPCKKSVIVHREVGDHTETFGAALKGAMRHDPDILLLGEMREMETIKLALSCASMGMLVFGTLHTNNARKTVDRIVDVFPADQQSQVRTMLAASLRGVVAQLLCKRVDQPGRTAVHEIMFATSAVAAIIREGATQKLYDVITSGKNEGMQFMDESIWTKLSEGKISPQEAYMKAIDKTRFKKFLPSELSHLGEASGESPMTH